MHTFRITPQKNHSIPVLLFVLVSIVFMSSCGLAQQDMSAPKSVPPPSADQDKAGESGETAEKEPAAEESTAATNAGGAVSPLPTPSPRNATARDESEAIAESDDAPVASGRQELRKAEEEALADVEEEIPLEHPSVASAPVRPRPQGRPAPLKAGERDDNAQFEEYLRYLDTYQGEPARQVDVRERYLITLLDNDQQPLLDATVRIYADEQQIFSGRTYAGGKTIFLPGARDVSENTTQFRLVAEKGEAQVEMMFERGARERIEVALKDATMSEELRLDVLFLLDTTGSMEDELSRIQETIDSIAQRIDSFTPRPVLRFGLVAYRDRGDAYVTRTYDFTSDVATFRKLLNSFTADGGGDTPESVNEALHAAVQEVQWAEEAVRLIFLVADAGPHLDYENDYDYTEEIQQAVAKGIKIYPIAASNTDPFAEYVFRQMAQQTLARFLFLTYQQGQEGGVPGESTSLQAGEQTYTVDRLDDLIVQVIQRELAAVRGIG
jgi:Mg-chelatase subunit ChlD